MKITNKYQKVLEGIEVRNTDTHTLVRYTDLKNGRLVRGGRWDQVIRIEQMQEVTDTDTNYITRVCADPEKHGSIIRQGLIA